jgi:hypothetical protein
MDFIGFRIKEDIGVPLVGASQSQVMYESKLCDLFPGSIFFRQPATVAGSKIFFIRVLDVEMFHRIRTRFHPYRDAAFI